MSPCFKLSNCHTVNLLAVEVKVHNNRNIWTLPQVTWEFSPPANTTSKKLIQSRRVCIVHHHVMQFGQWTNRLPDQKTQLPATCKIRNMRWTISFQFRTKLVQWRWIAALSHLRNTFYCGSAALPCLAAHGNNVRWCWAATYRWEFPATELLPR